MVMAKPAASPLKNSSRVPVSISSSAATTMRWNTSSVSNRSRTTAPAAGAPLRERSTASRTDSSSGPGDEPLIPDLQAGRTKAPRPPTETVRSLIV